MHPTTELQSLLPRFHFYCDYLILPTVFWYGDTLTEGSRTRKAGPKRYPSHWHVRFRVRPDVEHVLSLTRLYRTLVGMAKCLWDS